MLFTVCIFVGLFKYYYFTKAAVDGCHLSWFKKSINGKNSYFSGKIHRTSMTSIYFAINVGIDSFSGVVLCFCLSGRYSIVIPLMFLCKHFRFLKL